MFHLALPAASDVRGEVSYGQQALLAERCQRPIPYSENGDA